eukprot:125456_1
MVLNVVLSNLNYVICGMALIVGSLSVYFISHIWTYRRHKFIQSRYPILTYSVLWIFFSLLILAIINAIMYDLIDAWNDIYFVIINDAIQYACIFAYATRAWLLFYYVRWSHESVNQMWKTQLTENEEQMWKTQLTENEEQDVASFYITYRESLGNWKKIFPIVMIAILPIFIFFADILPLVIFNVNKDFDAIILRTIQFIIHAIILYIVYTFIQKIKIEDKYAIVKELKGMNLSFTIFILTGRIWGMSIFLVNKTKEPFITSISTIFSILFAIYIGSFWVLRKLFQEFAGNDTIKNLEARRILKKMVTVCSSGARKNETLKPEIEKHPISLNQMLSDRFGFELFAQFLITELSVQNILFLIEVKQYKACCRKYHKSENEPLSTVSVVKPTNIPVSLRPTTTTKSKGPVFQSKGIMNVEYIPATTMLQQLDPYDYAMYLYNKYVIDGRDLQINMASKTHKNLTKFLIKTDKTDIILMDDYTDQMFKLYDKAWEQIHTLIKSDSYSRFKYTKEYNDLCIRAKEEDDKKAKENAYASEFLNKPKPSILDWKYNETVMISNYSPPNTSIPEDAEVEMHDYEEELQKLNSINKYDTKTK